MSSQPVVVENDSNNNNNASENWSAARLFQASYKDLGSPSAVEDRFYRHLLEHCQEIYRIASYRFNGHQNGTHKIITI